MAEGLRAVRERDESGGPLLDEAGGERICDVQPDVRIALGEWEPNDPGTLYITTRHIFWLSNHDPQRGWSLDLLSLTMHAISRDPNAYHSPCIYAQIETVRDDENEDGDTRSPDEHEFDDLSGISELRFVPRDPSVLDNIFRVLCECMTLNPDPIAVLEGEGEWVFNIDEMCLEDDNHSNYLEELQIRDPRFDDPEESEDGENGLP